MNTKPDIYTKVTNQIIADLERGNLTWLQPWQAGHHEGNIATLPALDAMLSDPKRPIQELWKEMTTYKHGKDAPHPAVAAAGRDMLDRAKEEAGSVLSSTKSYLSLYRDPVVAKNVSKSEFRIHDLMNHHDPVSLYIITQPNDKARLSAWHLHYDQ